jgi:hypothetical protein
MHALLLFISSFIFIETPDHSVMAVLVVVELLAVYSLSFSDQRGSSPNLLNPNVLADKQKFKFL